MINIIGNRYGRLVVLARIMPRESDIARYPKYLCRCDCGKETPVWGSNLKGHNTLSCGCYRREVSTARALGKEKPQL